MRLIMKYNFKDLLMHASLSSIALMRAIQTLIFTFSICFIPVVFASSTGWPVITISFNDQLAGQMPFAKPNVYYSVQAGFEWSREESPWQFTSGIAGSDVYVGVLSPERDKIWTWTQHSDEFTLNDGYVPFAQATTVGTFFTGLIDYKFSGNEPKGMYLLFLILVGPGSDPSDVYNWQAVGSQPFFFLD